MHQEKQSRRSPLVWMLVIMLVVIAVVMTMYRPGRPTHVSTELMSKFNSAVALLEQYKYKAAYDLFREVVDEEPNLAEAQFNLALAALNRKGVEESRKKTPGGGEAVSKSTAVDYFKVAEEACHEALRLDSDLLHARFVLGLIYRRSQRLPEALAAFEAVVSGDPSDPYARYWYAKVLEDTDRLQEAVSTYEKVLEMQPALGSTYWRLSQLYRRVGSPEKAMAVLAKFKSYRDAKEQEVAGDIYGESGKYLQAIRDLAGLESTALYTAVDLQARDAMVIGKPPVAVMRPDGGIAAPGRAVGDINGDTLLDLIICGQPAGEGKTGVAIYLGSTGGTLSPGPVFPSDAISCALGDLDNDADLDLVLASPDRIEMRSNDGRGTFNVGALQLPAALPGFPVKVLLFDADSDWDLDVVVVCQTRDGDTTGGRLVILNNNRNGTFEDIASKAGIDDLGITPIDGLFGDLDGDIDQDLVILDNSGGVHVILNDRIWIYRHRRPDMTGLTEPGSKRAELMSTSSGGVMLTLIAEDWRKSFTWTADGSFEKATPPSGGAYSFGDQATLGFDALMAIHGADGRSRVLAFKELVEGEHRWSAGVVTSGSLPKSWIALDLNGPDKPLKDNGGMWSNLLGVGATVEVRAGLHHEVVRLNGRGGGSSRAGTRLFFQLPDGTKKIDYVRILWPDGVLQAELGLAAQQLHSISEVERKPTSCPVLFAWAGDRFEYIGDFLGTGGIGYFEMPGYNTPDPTELLEIPGLEPRTCEDGSKRLQLRIVEPLEECAYLDRARLLVADHHPGVTTHPHEIFAIRAPVPAFDIVAYREPVFPDRCLDHAGNDVTKELRHVDREYPEHWKKDPRFPGIAAIEHAVILEFRDDIEKLLESSVSPVLMLHGYIEYGYSTSNFAAGQARLEILAPTVTVERAGQWVPLREQWGFPAGTPRWMAIDLADLLQSGDRRIKISTNMEIYWDQVFLVGSYNAVDKGDLRLTELAVDTAWFQRLGFPRDGFPDGRHPRLYDYHDIVPYREVVGRTMKPFPGNYTRYGDVLELLESTDDRFVVMGPGDEIAISFDPDRLPALPDGWRRTYFLMASGWCKDMDLYTAFPDAVEPLPFQDMAGYPLPEDGSRCETFHDDETRSRTAQEYHTREVEGLEFMRRTRP